MPVSKLSSDNPPPQAITTEELKVVQAMRRGERFVPEAEAERLREDLADWQAMHAAELERYGNAMIEVERLRELLEESRDWMDAAGDFMKRPIDLLFRIDAALDKGRSGKQPDG